ncbi:hypothetical protein D9758_007774 [Tetrapyrgos nigripes]|uniref:Uncharacterized protein n=1 Tax=Tetrapyrgos nigripes TaxID=182062 RepID=A0A8H5CZ62_9AGAR|nr:hypothetical protein D9758_007774 [Tetrapyrgos nigripes]
MMQASSPLHFPSTPHSDRVLNDSNHTQKSSPFLPSPSPSPLYSSPIAEAQARRRKSQYKSRATSGSMAESPIHDLRRSSRSSNNADPSLSRGAVALVRPETRAFSKDRRSSKKAGNAKASTGKRRTSLMGSGDVFMDCEMEEEDEGTDDELYRRVITNGNRQDRRKVLLTFYEDCGSSFDPDLEDVGTWEYELTEPEPQEPGTSTLPVDTVLIPDDLEQAELDAYAAEYEEQAALADFEDIPLEELFGAHSDMDEADLTLRQDEDMDMQL